MKIIEVHGPSLADSNLDIQCNDILFITDTFLQSDLENILLKNNTPKYIVNNHYSFIEDLDQYLEFCQDFGYRYNEADLYNFKSYAWQQFSKHAQGKNAKNMWWEDARRLAGFRPA